MFVHCLFGGWDLLDLPITSAVRVVVMNQESSPNLPNLYLEFSRSLGKPQTTLTKCGWDFDKWGSIKVENLFNRTLDKARPVRQIDCIFTDRLSLFNID